MRGVQRSEELARILALPRRTSRGVEDLVEPLSAYLRRSHVCRPRDGSKDLGCADGFIQLNLLQTQSLVEFHDSGGLFLQGPLGCGKTGVAVLAPRFLERKRALYVVPGGAIRSGKVKNELATLRQHWDITPFRCVSYQKLAHEKAEFFFFEPPGPYDCIILDEAQMVKNEAAAVTRRIARLIEHENQTIEIVQWKTNTRVVVQVPAVPPIAVMTATPVKDSVMQVGHQMEWALGDRSPLPRPTVARSELMDWGCALDADPDERIRPGALTVLSGGNDALEYVRKGVAERIFSTVGCIASQQSYVDVKLAIHLRNVPLSAAEDECFKTLRGDGGIEFDDDGELKYPGWRTPDGEIFTDPADMWRHACSLALGYFTKWSPPAPKPWRKARYEWFHAVREVLKRSRTIDTVKQVASAVDSGRIVKCPVDGQDTLLAPLLNAWREIEPTFVPNSIPVWVGDTALGYAANWLRNGGIAWTQHVHFGKELAKRAGVPYFGEGGIAANGESIVTTKAPAIVASVAANGAMYNLQAFCRNLFCSIWPAGYVVEQCIGRTHRQGQKKDVSVDWLVSCREQLAGHAKAADSHGPFMRDLFRVPSRLCGSEIRSETITTSGWAFAEQEA